MRACVCPQLMKINILHPNNKLIGLFMYCPNLYIHISVSSTNLFDRMLVRNVSISFYRLKIDYNHSQRILKWNDANQFFVVASLVVFI